MTITQTHTPLSPEAVAHAFLTGNAPEYLLVPGLTKALVRKSARGLQLFLDSVPEEAQRSWEVHVPRNPKFDEPDDGLLRRTEPDRTNDKKVLFHVRSDLPALLEKQGVVLTRELASWLSICNQIRADCLSSAFLLAQALDAECPELHSVERMREAENVNPSVYRIGIYDSGSTGFAKEHVDRNFATLHVGSSHKGLYFRTRHGVMEGPEPEDGEVLAFPSKMAEDLSGGKICALLHGSTPTLAKTPRWFGVFFIQMIA